MNTMNANTRKRNAAFLLIAPLAMAAVFMQPQAHASISPRVIQQIGGSVGVPAALLKPAPQSGTITVSGFAPKRMRHVLATAEGAMFSGRIGTVTATCAGHAMHVSQVLTLYRVNRRLLRECPSRGLSVTFTDKPMPTEAEVWEKAAILKHP